MSNPVPTTSELPTSEVSSNYIVAESTLTDRYQTTVPAPVRKALQLQKQDKLVYSIHADGSIQIRRADETTDDYDNDPIVEKFLAFLDREIEKHPERIVPLTAEWLEEFKELTEGVDVGDMSQPLSGDDD